MNSKTKQIKELWNDLAKDSGHAKIEARRQGKVVNIGLVNQFKLHDFIPNKWFDWQSKADAPIMIIGQDWGPYIELKKFIDDYSANKDQANFDYEMFLYKTFSSRTEKFIAKAIEQTYPHKNKSAMELSDYFFYTVAVLFTRNGKHFRGNHNFDPQQSALHSYPYLKKQIDIVKPKVIVPLGGLALDQIERYYGLNLKGANLTQKINNLPNGVIKIGETAIIPSFHPAAHVAPSIMMKNWGKI